jgi:hypothetical protein
LAQSAALAGVPAVVSASVVSASVVADGELSLPQAANNSAPLMAARANRFMGGLLQVFTLNATC